jgi:hypothetical protein
MARFVSPAAAGRPPERLHCIQTRINIDADEHPKIRSTVQNGNVGLRTIICGAS